MEKVYLHNQSGVRKSTGSYFTKPFAVDHLISQSVESTLDEHLERVRAFSTPSGTLTRPGCSSTSGSPT